MEVEGGGVLVGGGGWEGGGWEEKAATGCEPLLLSSSGNQPALACSQ